MEYNETGLWVLLGVCAAAGLAHQAIVRVKRGFYRSHSSWRDDPRAWLAAVVDTVMTGLGLGLAAATVLFLMAALLDRLGV